MQHRKSFLQKCFDKVFFTQMFSFGRVSRLTEDSNDDNVNDDGNEADDDAVMMMMMVVAMILMMIFCVEKAFSRFTAQPLLLNWPTLEKTQQTLALMITILMIIMIIMIMMILTIVIK